MRYFSNMPFYNTPVCVCFAAFPGSHPLRASVPDAFQKIQRYLQEMSRHQMLFRML